MIKKEKKRKEKERREEKNGWWFTLDYPLRADTRILRIVEKVPEAMANLARSGSCPYTLSREGEKELLADYSIK